MRLPPVYPILDTTTLAQRDISPELAAEALLDAGAQILQFRHKTHWTRDTLVTARSIAGLCAQAGATFVVNDRADYALLIPGAALHLGQDDLSPADARRILGPATQIGFSTHNEAQMRAAQNEPIQYVAFGPIFPTSTKENPDPTTGPLKLQAIRALTNHPLVAIGGITRTNARACLQAGADSVAVIADMLPLSCTKQTIRDRMTEWLHLTR